MKKMIPLLLFILFILSACGNNAIENGVFTFSAQDFQEVYEEESNQPLPDDLTLSDSILSIESADKEVVAYFLDTANHLLEDEKLDELANTFKENGVDGYMESESDKLLVTVRSEGEAYSSQVIVKTYE